MNPLPPEPISLATLQQEIRRCRRCELAGHLAEANPIVRRQGPARNVVIGQAPGPNADPELPSWPGSSGTLLRRWFARAGFDPAHFQADWYFTAMTRCFPGRSPNGPGDRAPSAAERKLCRSHLDAELALLQPRLIVTLGRLAAEAFVPGARGTPLASLVGTFHSIDLGWGEIFVVPLPHPSGVGRWLNHPANRAHVDRAMDHLHRWKSTQN